MIFVILIRIVYVMGVYGDRIEGICIKNDSRFQSVGLGKSRYKHILIRQDGNEKIYYHPVNVFAAVDRNLLKIPAIFLVLRGKRNEERKQSEKICFRSLFIKLLLLICSIVLYNKYNNIEKSERRFSYEDYFYWSNS